MYIRPGASGSGRSSSRHSIGPSESAPRRHPSASGTARIRPAYSHRRENGNRYRQVQPQSRMSPYGRRDDTAADGGEADHATILKFRVRCPPGVSHMTKGSRAESSSVRQHNSCLVLPRQAALRVRRIPTDCLHARHESACLPPPRQPIRIDPSHHPSPARPLHVTPCPVPMPIDADHAATTRTLSPRCTQHTHHHQRSAPTQIRALPASVGVQG